MLTLAQRINKLHDWANAAIASKADVDRYSLKRFKRDIIQNNKETELAMIEVEDAKLKTSHDRFMGAHKIRRKMEFGRRVVSTIRHLNDKKMINENSLIDIYNDPELTTIKQMFLEGDLDLGRKLFIAKDLSAFPPMDDSFKTRVNKMVTKFLTKLENEELQNEEGS